MQREKVAHIFPMKEGVPNKKTLSKKERLYHKIEINALFSQGHSFFMYPFKVFWQVPPQATPLHKVLVSVSKKNTKRAVDRNLIKRRIKEAYRIEKNEGLSWTAKKQVALTLGFVYVGKEILPYALLLSKIIVILQHLEKEYDAFHKNRTT